MKPDTRYIGRCVENPFADVKELTAVVESARQITKRTFMSHCDVGNDVREMMRRFPSSYTYWKSKDADGNVIYFFEWSRIEFFFRKER